MVGVAGHKATNQIMVDIVTSWLWGLSNDNYIVRIYCKKYILFFANYIKYVISKLYNTWVYIYIIFPGAHTKWEDWREGQVF